MKGLNGMSIMMMIYMMIMIIMIMIMIQELPFLQGSSTASSMPL